MKNKNLMIQILGSFLFLIAILSSNFGFAEETKKLMSQKVSTEEKLKIELNALEKIWGKNTYHPKILKTLERLAAHYSSKKKPAKVKKYVNQAAKILAKTPKNKIPLKDYEDFSNLATHFLDPETPHYKLGLQLAFKDLEIAHQMKDSPTFLGYRKFVIAKAHFRLENWQDFERYIKYAIADWEEMMLHAKKKYGGDFFPLPMAVYEGALKETAYLFAEINNFKRAEEFFLKNEDVYTRYFPKNTYHEAYFYTKFAQFYQSQKKYKKAQAALQKAEAILTKNPAMHPKSKVMIFEPFVDFYKETNQHQKVKFYQDKIKKLKNSAGYKTRLTCCG